MNEESLDDALTDPYGSYSTFAQQQALWKKYQAGKATGGASIAPKQSGKTATHKLLEEAIAAGSVEAFVSAQYEDDEDDPFADLLADIEEPPEEEKPVTVETPFGVQKISFKPAPKKNQKGSTSASGGAVIVPKKQFSLPEELLAPEEKGVPVTQDGKPVLGSWKAFSEALNGKQGKVFHTGPHVAEEGSGVCYCGASMEGHPVWDNHSPVEMPLPEEQALQEPELPDFTDDGEIVTSVLKPEEPKHPECPMPAWEQKNLPAQGHPAGTSIHGQGKLGYKNMEELAQIVKNLYSAKVEQPIMLDPKQLKHVVLTDPEEPGQYIGQQYVGMDLVNGLPVYMTPQGKLSYDPTKNEKVTIHTLDEYGNPVGTVITSGVVNVTLSEEPVVEDVPEGIEGGGPALSALGWKPPADKIAMFAKHYGASAEKMQAMVEMHEAHVEAIVDDGHFHDHTADHGLMSGYWIDGCKKHDADLPKPVDLWEWKPLTGLFKHPWEGPDIEPHDHPAEHPPHHKMGKQKTTNGVTQRHCLAKACNYMEEMVPKPAVPAEPSPGQKALKHANEKVLQAEFLKGYRAAVEALAPKMHPIHAAQAIEKLADMEAEL